MTDIIDDTSGPVPTSPFPPPPLSFTAADLDTIGHLSGVELNDVARTTQTPDTPSRSTHRPIGLPHRPIHRRRHAHRHRHPTPHPPRRRQSRHRRNLTTTRHLPITRAPLRHPRRPPHRPPPHHPRLPRRTHPVIPHRNRRRPTVDTRPVPASTGRTPRARTRPTHLRGFDPARSTQRTGHRPRSGRGRPRPSRVRRPQPEHPHPPRHTRTRHPRRLPTRRTRRASGGENLCTHHRATLF